MQKNNYFNKVENKISSRINKAGVEIRRVPAESEDRDNNNPNCRMI